MLIGRRRHRERRLSLTELRMRELDAQGRQSEDRWRSEAEALGLPEATADDPWKVLEALNRYRDELRRPDLEQQARTLGMRVERHWSVTELSLAIFDEQRRQNLQARADRGEI